MSNVSATLTTHKGAVRISRDELFSIPAPQRTLTHTPVAHRTLVENLETRLSNHGYQIRGEEYAVQHDGLRLFGILKLAYQTRQNFSFALAFRTANDRTCAITLIAGINVFVCDNMALSGDAEILSKRHSGSLNIRQEIFGGIDRAVQRFGALDINISRLTNTGITDIQAKALIVDAAVSGVISGNDVKDVVKEYFEPRHSEFEARTLWSLHNAFTETFKSLRPNIALEANQKLGTLFQI